MGEQLRGALEFLIYFAPIGLASMAVTAAGIFVLAWVGLIPGSPVTAPWVDADRTPHPQEDSDDMA